MGVAVRNLSDSESIEQLVVPTKADGSFYRFEMIADGGRTRFYDDTTLGLMEYLIAGYSALPVEDQLAVRIRHAADTQVRLQARLNMFFLDSPKTAAEQAVLTGDRHIQPTTLGWGCIIPLVLIDAYYAPFSEMEPPFSTISDTVLAPNIWWLRPAESEMDYLRSLHEASVIDVNVSLDEVA